MRVVCFFILFLPLNIWYQHVSRTHISIVHSSTLLHQRNNNLLKRLMFFIHAINTHRRPSWWQELSDKCDNNKSEFIDKFLCQSLSHFLTGIIPFNLYWWEKRRRRGINLLPRVICRLWNARSSPPCHQQGLPTALAHWHIYWNFGQNLSLEILPSFTLSIPGHEVYLTMEVVLPLGHLPCFH